MYLFQKINSILFNTFLQETVIGNSIPLLKFVLKTIIESLHVLLTQFLVRMLKNGANMTHLYPLPPTFTFLKKTFLDVRKSHQK